MDTETLKAVVPFVAPVISQVTGAVIETWLKPKLAERAKKGKVDRELLEHSSLVTNKFQEYLERAYEKQSSLATVVFQNQSMPLRDLYLPLTVQATHRNQTEIPILLDRYKDEFIPNNQRVLLTDDAGMGKSTLLRFLFLQCIDENKGLPIFVELRRLVDKKNIVDVIHEDLNPIDDDINRDFILKLIRRGDFVFFLDGYDEIPFAERESVTANLQQFIGKAGKNFFILSSRPDSALSSFPRFKHFTIVPLKEQEAFELLQRYDQGEDKALSSELISELNRQIESVEEFLINPMLVSLLFKAYDYKRDVPLKKHAFYRQVFDALFEDHDFKKPLFKREKFSGLDKDDFENVLRSLGFFTVTQGEVGYSKDELLSHINAAKRQTGLSFPESAFLSDLLQTVPLFAAEGDYHRWKHKSLQEYFAARFISQDAKSEQPEMLKKMAFSEKSGRYQNVLDLCYDLDYKTFRNSLIYPLVCDYLEHYESSYKKIDRSLISKNDIHLRKLLTYGRNFVIFSGFWLQDISDGSTIGRKFDDMARFARETYGLDCPSAGAGSSYWGNEGGVVVTEFKTNTLRIIQAKNKNVASVIQELRLVQDKHKFKSDTGESEERLFMRTYAPSEICECGKSFIITDDPSHICNNEKNFVKVNSLLSGSGGMLALDLEYCRRIKEEVEKDLIQSETAKPLASLL